MTAATAGPATKYIPEYARRARHCTLRRIKSMKTLLGAVLVSLAFAAYPAAETSQGAPLANFSEAGHFRVTANSELTPVPINRMHRWTLHVDSAAGTPVVAAEIEVSGGMPLHDHGLPTAPRVTKNFNNGDYLVEGIKFHMNGRWEIIVTVEAAGLRDVVVLQLDL